jgi:hypothetical protein
LTRAASISNDAEPVPDTDAILAQSEEELLRFCRVEFYKSGGPGGQKRNKTSSAAKITHTPSGVEAHSNDFRSQSENRVRALHRLRFKIAATLRTPMTLSFYEPPAWLGKYITGSKLLVNAKNHEFARAAAHVLDLLQSADGNYARVAALIGSSTSSLVRWLGQEHVIWDAACAIRRANGLSVSA